MNAETHRRSPLARSAFFVLASLLTTVALIWIGLYVMMRVEQSIAVNAGQAMDATGAITSPDEVQWLDFDRSHLSPRWFRCVFLPLMKVEELLRGFEGNTLFWEEHPATCRGDAPPYEHVRTHRAA